MSSYKEVIKTSLPELLFNGKVDGQTVNASLPKFQADRDQVSVVFFTIYSGTEYRGCAGRQKGSSVLPEDMFILESVDSSTRERFAASLENQLFKPCRFGGSLSPIATAPSLILPYLQGKLPADKLFSRTIIIEATNEIYNTTASPASELANFQRGFIVKGTKQSVEGTKEAVDKSYQVAASFYFNSPPNWNWTIGSLHLNTFEAVPLHPVETVLSYQRKMQVDRQAVSNDRLRLVPEPPHTGDLHVILDTSSAYRFRPLYMQLSFQGANGGAWRLGEQAILPDMSINLAPCQPPACVDEGDRIAIPLLAAAGESLYISPTDPELTAGKINFTVGFSYETGIYNHLFVKSSEQHIEVTPTQPVVVSGVFGIFPNVKLDNRELASLWRDDTDGVTTQAEANDRLQARHNQYWVMLLLLVIALVAALIFYLYRTKYQRPFQPSLEWKPASEVVVDFNRPAASRVLVGTLEVVNAGQVPWFGRLWHNEEQPTRDAVFTLTYDFFKESGLELTSLCPIGFIRVGQGDAEQDQLDLSTNEAVSHSKTIFLFLATESLLDYRQPSSNGEHVLDKSFNIDLLVRMEWGQNGEMDTGRNILAPKLLSLFGGKDHDAISCEMQCKLTIKPEQEHKPLVAYVASPEPKLVFKEGRKIQVGKFIFKSQAEHLFAAPFEWGDYMLQVYRGNKPLGGEPIKLAQSRLTLLPKAKAEVPVLLDCDGSVMTNPEPVSHAYIFKLLGNFDPSSEIPQHTMTIFRDDARAEIVLKILQIEPAREIYWTRDGRLEQRLVGRDGTEAGELPVEHETIWLDAQKFEFDASDNGPYDLLKLEVGNSATSGNGFVDVQVTTIFADEEVSSGIHLHDERQKSNLLGVYDFDQKSPHIHVAEGAARETRVIRFFPGFISRIDGAVVSSENLRTEVKLTIHVQTDQGEDTRRELRIIVPLGLEQLPSPNWLCIDYGTSAIAAAFGSGCEEQLLPIPLQEIKGRDEVSLASYDPKNMEKDSRFLLPSWVACDADIRETDTQPNKLKITRPGFPGYSPPSLKPGDPAFISLPAPNHLFADAPGRIIYSIKSWLGQSTANIPLETPVSYVKDDEVVTGTTLPLDKMVESSFAALIEGYLLAEGTDYRADQIIICHPNTFTRNHQQKLKEFAFRAFSRRFGIQRPERVHLISESDAVAYCYCRTQMKDNRGAGNERLLVYDFGAGTLDLSLIRIEWKKVPYCYPARWKVEGRIGVPVAGNYLDETLARIVDRLLCERLIFQSHAHLKYTYRVVGKSLVSGKDSEHRKAIKELWEALRKAKHKWNGSGPLTVEVGLVTGEWGVVTLTGGEIGLEGLPKLPPPTDEVGLWTKQNSLYLSIPADVIHGDDRLKEFQKFVTETVIDELLHAANVPANEVNTIVVSGRGALWPGLRDDVWNKFPGAEHPDLLRDGTMKSAVVQGAIARQDLNIDFEEAEDENRFKPKLGVLINEEQDIITEDDWDKPIDLSRSPTFRIVQINLKEPNPRVDLKSLRKHFYIDVDGKLYRRRDNLIYVSRAEERNGKFMLSIRDSKGLIRSTIGETFGSPSVTHAPWP
ncbi:MAG: hypothetical protein WBP93_00675, partial [Pyrinomonadaceae bacterium]